MLTVYFSHVVLLLVLKVRLSDHLQWSSTQSCYVVAVSLTPCCGARLLFSSLLCDARQESEMETEEEVDILMSSDVYSATLSTKSISFARSQIGWLFREDKTVRTPCPTPPPLPCIIVLACCTLTNWLFCFM